MPDGFMVHGDCTSCPFDTIQASQFADRDFWLTAVHWLDPVGILSIVCG